MKITFDHILQQCGPHNSVGYATIHKIRPRVYDREGSIERRHTVHQKYAESNVTSCISHKLGICTLTNPSMGDVIYQESRLHHPTRGTVDRLHHPLLDWSVCKFQACDRYRMSRYSPHTSDTQYAYVQYSLSIIYTR